MAEGTHQAPNKDLQEKAARWENDGAPLSAALFVGFSNADIREAGLSAVVTTDGDLVAGAPHGGRTSASSLGGAAGFRVHGRAAAHIGRARQGDGA